MQAQPAVQVAQQTAQRVNVISVQLKVWLTTIFSVLDHQWVLVVVTAGLAVVTWRLVVQTRRLVTDAITTSARQAGEMKESLSIAARAADAATRAANASLVSLRPWLSCKVDIAGPLTYTEARDAQFHFQIEVKNVGHTPAMGVRLQPHLNLMSPQHEQSILILQRMADHNRAMPVGAAAVLLPGSVPIGSAELGIVLFPEETYTFNWTIPIKRDEIEKACADMMPDKHFWPELLGLVTYSYPLATARADTGFVCCVERALPDGPPGRVLRLDEPVSGENLRISDHSLWSGFAT